MANVSGFFNKLGKVIGEAADKTAETVGDLTQTGKYKLEINKLNGQVKDLQSALGKNIVEAKFSGKTNEELIAMIEEASSKVSAVNSEIKKVEQLIIDLGDKDSDGQCGCSCEESASAEACGCSCEESAPVESCGCSCEESAPVESCCGAEGEDSSECACGCESDKNE